jgi:hypothetical protein
MCDKNENVFSSQESFSALSQRIEFLSKELDNTIKHGITDKVTKENFFNNKEFFQSRTVAKFIKESYGLGKKLQHHTNRNQRGSSKVDLICCFPNCSFRIVCRKGRKSCFSFDEISSNLNHGIYDNEGCLVGLCTDWNSISTVVNYSYLN